MSGKEFMLTTIDNPFNPFTNYDEWLAFDEDQGYHTCSLLARNLSSSDSLTDEQNSNFVDDAITDVIDNDLTGLYIRVTKDLKIRPYVKNKTK